MGRITIDDIVDSLKEAERYQLAVEYRMMLKLTMVFLSLQKLDCWLFLGLLGGLGGVFILQDFEKIMDYLN